MDKTEQRALLINLLEELTEMYGERELTRAPWQRQIEVLADSAAKSTSYMNESLVDLEQKVKDLAADYGESVKCRRGVEVVLTTGWDTEKLQELAKTLPEVRECRVRVPVIQRFKRR